LIVQDAFRTRSASAVYSDTKTAMTTIQMTCFPDAMKLSVCCGFA
jgi:hypothetical protein